MPLCMFRYVFDTNIMLPNDCVFPTVIDNQVALIRAISLDGEKLFSFESNNYDWLSSTDSNVNEVRVTSINRLKRRFVARKWRFFKGESFFKGGYIDPIKYSLIEVVFQIESINQLKDDHFMQQIKKCASRMVQHFIDIYKLIAQDFTITKKSIDDSPVIEIMVSEEGAITEVEINQVFKAHTQNFQWKDPFKKGFSKDMMAKDNLDTFNRVLQLNQNISLHDKLLLQSREQAYYGNFDVSVTLAETAFEVFLQNKLLYLCEKKSVYELEVGRGSGTKNYKEVIEGGNVRELLKKYFPMFMGGRNLTEGKVYIDWYEHAYRLRNNIIHKGMNKTDEEMCNKAFYSIIKFISDIDNLVE